MFFLFKKMIRSIKQFKFQFLSVVLLAMLSVIIFSGLEGVYYGMKHEFDTFNKDTNLADEWVQATYFTNEDIELIKKTKGIETISKRIRITVSVNNDSYLILDSNDNTNISSIKVLEGDDYDSKHNNCIWIDSEYAKANEISVGDSLELNYNNQTVNPIVAGLIMSSERAHFVGSSDYYMPSHEKYGYGYMSDDIVSKFNTQGIFNLLEIKSNNSTLEDNINEMLGDRFIAYFNRDTLMDISFVSNQVDNLKRVSLLFSVLFILLSLLSMRTTIKRLIDAQSSDINTLKSLGFSNISLLIYYSMYGLFLSVVGTGLGYILSFPFTKAIQQSQKKIIALPNWPIIHSKNTFIVIMFIIILSILTSISAARKTLTGLPAETKHNTVRHNKQSILEKIPHIWNKFGFGMKWTIRDATYHKTRIILGIISVCGSFMLLMIGFGTPDSIKNMTKKSYNDEFTYSYKYTLNPTVDQKNINELNKELDGQLIETIQTRVAFANKEDVYHKPITIISDGDFINLKTVDGEIIKDDGIYITEGMANSVNAKKDDFIKVFPSFSNQAYKFKIAGIIPSSMPQSLYIKNKCFMSSGATFKPTSILSKKYIDFKDDGRISQTISVKHQEDNLIDFSHAISGVFTLMKVIAFILVIIVLYNLGILSFLERTNEYNTFRVLGFHYREIRKLASFESILILVFGALLGLPFGFKFLSVYCDTFSNDTIKIYPNIFGLNLLIVCTTITICSLIIILLLSMRIKKIDMIKALKE